MALSSLKVANKLTVGPRYVFFQSLTSAIPPIYSKIYAQGMSYVNAAQENLHPDISSSSEQDLARIRDYVNYVKSLADTEAKNEINFINQFTNIINQLKNSKLKEEMLNFINDIQDGNVQNYKKFISVINTIMTQNQDFIKKRQEAARESMKFVDEAYSKASTQMQEDIASALHEERYNDYQKLLRETYPETQDTSIHKFSQAISVTFGNKFSSILQRIANDQQLINQLGQAWKNNTLKINFSTYIIAIVAKYIETLNFNDLKTNSVARIMKNIKTQPNALTSLTNQISEEYANNILNLLSKKKVVEKTLEEIALTTRRGLGEEFLKLEDSSMQDIVNLYSQYGFNQKTYNKIINIQDPKKRAAAITDKLGRAIRRKAREQWGISVTDKYSKEQREQIEKLLITNDKFQQAITGLKRKLNPQYLKNQLQVKMTGPASAEEMAANVIKNLSQQEIIVLIGGGKIKAKDDIIFSYTGNINFDNIIDDKNISNAIKEEASHFNEDFIKRNHEKIGDQIIAKVKEENYLEELRSLRDYTKQQLSELYSGEELDQKVAEVLNQLNNLITGGIQVKDYVHGSSLGFMGESLGTNGEQILKNIDEMYAVGGISKIDMDLLYFVMANCGIDGIAVDLKEDLAYYLLGGAMMLLFDDGFTAAQKFLDNVKLEFGFAPSTLHLFNLQGGHFIPASFVYNSIYNNLIQVYSDLEIQVTNSLYTGNASNTITIVNNISEDNKPSWIDMPKPQERWDTVSNMVNTKENIDIKLTFLAGILDMFEAIPKAFNV